jgi:hypothetical protein
MHTFLIGSNDARGLETHGGQHSPSHTETNLSSFEQGKYRLRNIVYVFTSQTLLFALIVHLHIGVL